jgi:hypothetical protein
MTALQLYELLVGQDSKIQTENIAEKLKGLPLMSLADRSEFSRGMILGRLESLGFKFKYSGGYGHWPIEYLRKTEAQAIIHFAVMDKGRKSNKSPKSEPTEEEKKKGMLRAKGLYQAVNKSKNNGNKS